MKIFEHKNWGKNQLILCKDIEFYGNPVDKLCTLSAPIFLKRLPTKNEAQFLFSIIDDKYLSNYGGLNFNDLKEIEFPNEK